MNKLVEWYGQTVPSREDKLGPVSLVRGLDSVQSYGQTGLSRMDKLGPVSLVRAPLSTRLVYVATVACRLWPCPHRRRDRLHVACGVWPCGLRRVACGVWRAACVLAADLP